jgi:hypothetical protein
MTTVDARAALGTDPPLFFRRRLATAARGDYFAPAQN